MTTLVLLLLALLLVSVWLGFYALVKQQGRILLRLDQLEENAKLAALALVTSPRRLSRRDFLSPLTSPPSSSPTLRAKRWGSRTFAASAFCWCIGISSADSAMPSRRS